MREITVDHQRDIVIFRRCFFHPFFPVFRRNCELNLADIGQPFIARSGEGGSGNKILLPTIRGYVYFRNDRQADNATLRAIRKAQARYTSEIATDELTRLSQRANRLPTASRMALAACLILVIAGLWFYYTHVLPEL